MFRLCRVYVEYFTLNTDMDHSNKKKSYRYSLFIKSRMLQWTLNRAKIVEFQQKLKCSNKPCSCTRWKRRMETVWCFKVIPNNRMVVLLTGGSTMMTIFIHGSSIKNELMNQEPKEHSLKRNPMAPINCALTLYKMQIKSRETRCFKVIMINWMVFYLQRDLRLIIIHALEECCLYMLYHKKPNGLMV